MPHGETTAAAPGRIVLTSWGSFGDVYPYIGLGRALARRGHDPVLAVPSYYKAIVEREGLEHRPVGPDVDPNDRATLARIMHPVRGTEAILRDLLMPALRRSHAELLDAARDASLLVTHPVTFAAPIVAVQRRLPWVSTVLAPISFFSAIDLPALPPAPRLVELRRLGPWSGRAMVRFARWMTRDWLTPVRELRAELGLPRGGDPLYEGQFSPTLTLAMFSRVLAEPQPDWPPGAKTTGFVFYNGADGLPPAVAGFLDAGPPPVVFTLGTSAVGAAGRFYEESAAAARRLGVRAILLTGPFRENVPAGAAAGDLLVVEGAPHQLLFPRAAAIVHQGGIGTTGQALRSGRPMLVVPHSHDQPDNAYRVGRLGVARTLYPPQYRARRVAREIGRLLADPAYAERAAGVAAAVQAERGAEAAADALEQVLRGAGSAAAVTGR